MERSSSDMKLAGADERCRNSVVALPVTGIVSIGVPRDCATVLRYSSTCVLRRGRECLKAMCSVDVRVLYTVLLHVRLVVGRCTAASTYKLYKFYSTLHTHK